MERFKFYLYSELPYEGGGILGPGFDTYKDCLNYWKTEWKDNRYIVGILQWIGGDTK